MRLPVPLRRLAFRSAYLGLRVYWLLLHPNSSGVKCVLSSGECILLVRHTYGPDRWDLPGGSMKRGESPVATAKREMHEELGVQIENWTRLTELTIDANHHQDHIHYLMAELPATAVSIDRGELDQARWFSRRELPPDLGQYARAIIDTLPSLR